MKEILWNTFAVIGMGFCMVCAVIIADRLWYKFKKRPGAQKTWLLQFTGFLGLWKKRWRTGWLLAERANLITYDAYERGFAGSKGIGWIKKIVLRWLAADRLKKYPDYLTATQEFEVWGGTVSDLTVEHVRAYTEAEAQQIAENRKPEVKFNMVITRRNEKEQR